MRGHEQSLALRVAKIERQGLPFVKTLSTVMLDPARAHSDRAAIGRLLSVAGDSQAVHALLKLFFEQTEMTSCRAISDGNHPSVEESVNRFREPNPIGLSPDGYSSLR